MIDTRYATNWYGKRIKQNAIIKTHLIEIINQHKEHNFPWTTKDLKNLNYEDLLEIAIATVNKNIAITLGAGSDFSNGVDAKFSIARTHGKSYGAGITGCKNKEHVYACVYEGITKKFYYFSFPVTVSEHEVGFDKITGDPKRNGYMWKKYECSSFETMALSQN